MTAHFFTAASLGIPKAQRASFTTDRLTIFSRFSRSGGNFQKMQRSSLFLVFLSVVLLLFSCCVVEAAKDSSRTIDIMNRSGHRVSLYWINRWKNDELVLNTEEPVLHGADSRINSFVTHEFEIQEEPHKKTNKCSGPDGKCRKAQFQVNANHGQTIKVLENLELEFEDDKTRAKEQANAVVQQCKAQFAERQKGDDNQDPYKLLEEMTACIQDSVDASLEEKNEEIEFQSQVRTKLGERLTGYACSDVNATTTEAVENTTWTYRQGSPRQTYQVRVLLDRPASKISLIENFVSKEECQAAEKAITTERVNANGLSARKGGLAFPPKDDKENELLSTMASRIYSLVEETLDSRLEMKNREDLLMLHYEGKKKDHDTNPDQYAPHCDGKCDGSYVDYGDVIATVIMYCEVPSAKGAGGDTHFPNSGTHIKPKTGDAVLIGYVDPSTSMMDAGMTNYTDCPVMEGDKKILVHKLRLATYK